MQNSGNIQQPSGSLRISQDVIATIAKYAASEIDGVACIAARPNPVKIKNWISKKVIQAPISIDLNDDVAVIEISVKLKYGAKIPQVSETLQKAVKEAVQNMTGIAVSKVNINVAGIVFNDKTTNA